MESFKFVDFRLGTIVAVRDNIKARKPAYVVEVDLGSTIGIKTTSAQLTTNYTKESLLSKQVFCVVNFPRRNIAGVQSEVLMIGFPDSNGHVSLLNARSQRILNGTSIVFNENEVQCAASALPETSYEKFEEGNVIAGSIMECSNEDILTRLMIDFGETVGLRTLFIANLSPDIEYSLLTSVAASIDFKADKIIPLTIRNSNGLLVLLGVDQQVPNGGKLF